MGARNREGKPVKFYALKAKVDKEHSPFFAVSEKIDGKWYTPPVDVGILDGICRQKLIKEGRVFEAYLTKDDLKKASHIYVCNSVRGVYEITLNK